MGDVRSVSEYRPLTKTQSYQMLNKQDIECLELFPKSFVNAKASVWFYLDGRKRVTRDICGQKKPIKVIQFFEP